MPHLDFPIDSSIAEEPFSLMVLTSAFGVELMSTLLEDLGFDVSSRRLASNNVLEPNTICLHNKNYTILTLLTLLFKLQTDENSTRGVGTANILMS